jgi:hypothetical protein
MNNVEQLQVEIDGGMLKSKQLHNGVEFAMAPSRGPTGSLHVKRN